VHTFVNISITNFPPRPQKIHHMLSNSFGNEQTLLTDTEPCIFIESLMSIVITLHLNVTVFIGPVWHFSEPSLLLAHVTWLFPHPECHLLLAFTKKRRTFCCL
jgi:hypothetical protein